MTRPPIDMEPLSFDAKVVAGACFGMMGPKSSLAFEMRQGRPGDRCKVALDELVEAEVLTVEPINAHGGVKYRPLRDCHDAFVWVMKLKGRDKALMKFPISVPINEPAASSAPAQAPHAAAHDASGGRGSI